MPSPQAVVTFVAVLFVMLIVLHVPLALPPNLSAAGSFVLAFGAGWVVNRRVPDVDDDVTQDSSNGAPDPEPSRTAEAAAAGDNAFRDE